MKRIYTVLFTLCSVLGFSQVQYGWRELSPQSPLPVANTFGQQIQSMVVDTAGNVYVSGFEDTSGYYNVWEWNGSQWSEVGTGSHALNAAGTIPLFIDSGNVLYAGTYRWNGHAWSTMPYIPDAGSIYCTDLNGNIFAASYSSNYGPEYIYEWQGGAWQTYSTVPYEYVGAMCATKAGLFAAVGDTAGLMHVIYVGEGGAYNEIGFGPNENSSDGGHNYQTAMVADTSGNYFYVARADIGTFEYNGTYLSLVGGEGIIGDEFNNDAGSVQLCMSKWGTLYSSGFSDTAGYSAVIQLNDTVWSVLGTGNYKLPAKQQINTICAGNQGNVFAAGAFTDGNGKIYVAEYGPVPAGNVYTFITPTDANCGRNGSVTTEVYGGAPPYRYLWSNDSTTANLNSVTNGSYSVTITDALGRFTTGSATVGNSCYSIISGNIFYDANGNCVYDSTADRPITDYVVTIKTGNGSYYYGNSNGNGNYTIEVPDSGTMQVLPDIYSNYCGQLARVCGSSDSIFIANLGDTLANVTIAISGGSGFDLTLHPGWTSANPGFVKQYWVMPYNLSPDTVSGNVTVVFNYDSNLVYQNSLAPMPTVDAVNHTLTWVVSGSSIPYLYFDWNYERFVSNFLVPAGLNPGYQLQSSFVVLPTTGDCDTANNYFNFSQAVTGSHDPNGKEVSPAGELTSGDSVLTYTIYFQNTGTDSTNFIIIRDTLSPYLNPASVVNLASSAPYSAFTITGTGILTWTFNPLRIPDSTTNNAASKGFITFSIKTKANLAQGTNISNTASVYFDYNQGVQTNTTSSMVAAVTGVSVLQQQNVITVKAQPNPFSDLTQIVVSGLHDKFDFELYDVTGRLQVRIPSLQTNQFNVRGDELPAGIYLYRIVTGNQQVNGKLVKE